MSGTGGAPSAGRLAGILLYAWASPVSAAGLLLALLARLTGGEVRRVAGVLEASGGAVAFLLARALPGFPVSALTLGHVVLGRSGPLLEATRVHERVHVRQAERWGPLFPLAYGLASLAALARGGNAYRDNPFERAAFEEEARVAAAAAAGAEISSPA